MYEDEVQQLPAPAESGHHHFRDVLQAFVQDFSLRQAAGETKIREIERQLSDATGEIHLLRHLLEEYQTKFNDDNVLIMRLHQEIEALQGRVSNLDKKTIKTEALGSRLEIRLEHLKQCWTQTCNDTQKGVSKLLGNFAKVHFSGEYGKKEELRPTKEAKEQEASVRRKNVSSFAPASYSDGKGCDNKMTPAMKSTGDFALNEKQELIHSTYSRQISADKPHAFQSSAKHEYVIPTNDDSMTNECPSTDITLTNELNPTTAEFLPSTSATYLVKDTISHQPVGDTKTVNFSNNTSTKHTSSQDSSNFTAKIPSNTKQGKITAPASTRSNDNTPTSDSAHLQPATGASLNEKISSTGNGCHGLPKGKKAPKGNRGQWPVKNRKHPRTTSLSEGQGRSNIRHRTISLSEEQSNIQLQRRTVSFCEDQLHSNRKDRPANPHREELNTSRKQRTSSFSGELGQSNRKHCTSINEDNGSSNRKNRTGVNEQGKSKNWIEQANSQVSQEQVTIKSKEQPISTRDNNEQGTSSSKSTEQTRNHDNKEQSSTQARNEQITSKGNQEQVNNLGNEEHITAQASKEQITSKGNQDQVNNLGNEEHITAQDSKEQITSKGNQDQVNNLGNEEHITAQDSKEQITSKDNQEQVNNLGNEEHITAQASKEQITSKGRNKQVNKKGNERQGKKSNGKQVNKGNERQVKKNSNEKQVNMGNERQLNERGNEKQVNMGNKRQLEKSNEKQVNKGNERQVNEKGNEKQVNKGNERQVNEKSNEKQANLKASEEQPTIPDTVDKVSQDSEKQVSSHNSVDHCVAQGSKKTVIPSYSEEQVISSQISEQTSLSSEKPEACQSTEEQVATLNTKPQITFWSSEKQTHNSEQQTSINTKKQTLQSGKEKDEVLTKGISSLSSNEEISPYANEEQRLPQGNEEQRLPQGNEKHKNHNDHEEQLTLQNRKHQHTAMTLGNKDRCLTACQSESSPSTISTHEHQPDGGATIEWAPQENDQDSYNVAATVDSSKTITAEQRKAKNKDKQAKWEENEKEKTKKQESIKLSPAKDESVFLPGLRRRSFRMEGEEDQQEQEVGMCANCGFLAKLRCANCRQAFYCKRECQREHWKKGHKDQCQPFQVMESSELGRYMVASRDLKAGDVIVKEEPAVVGPKQVTEPLCLGCYSKVDGSYRCQKCQWPMCGPECERALDHQPECVVGQEIGSPIEISNFDEPNHFYEVVFPLRCLALKKKSPKKYEQLLSLESHYEDRKGTHVHTENQKRIVNFLRNYFFIQEFPIEDIDSSERSIHNITGIIDVNALELRLKESEVLGLYPTFAMLEHSCTPNTKHTFNKDRQVVLKAAVDIKRGEHISTMYTHILWGTAARRDHLKHSKYFMCTCFRCSDPTELGTHFSALRCKQCTNGFMLSAAPLDELASWICTSCNATMSSEVVKDTNLKLGEDLETALAKPNREALEELLQRYAKNTVHPNHFHLFAARHTLLQMYGRDPNSADEAYMKKKEKMCQDFLKVCTALDPGMSRLAPYAGVALYEYHLAVLARVRQDPDAKQVDSTALKKDVETAKALLQQCIRVLQEEPADQPEGQLCHVAQQNLAELRQWEATLS